MNEIRIECNPSDERKDSLGLSNWPIWTKEVSEFPWVYDEQETCYFIEGEVVVTPSGGEPVSIGKGDLATFPEGMSCTWKIIKSVRKYYKFG